MSLQLALFNIAIFQGFLLGVIILRSPIYRSEANKYLAYAVFGLSFALLSLAAELTATYQENLLLRLVDAFCSGALFPVLILLFIVNQVDHPFRKDRRRWWLFAPHFLSVALSLLNMTVDLDAGFFVIKAVVDLIDVLLFLLTLVFIPGVLLYSYSFIKFADSRREKRWLIQLWLCFFLIMTGWVSSIFFAMFSLIDFAEALRIIALGAGFLIHWVTYIGIFKFKLAKDQEEIRTLIGKWKSGAVRAATPSLAVKEAQASATLTEDNAYFQKLETLCLHERIYLDNTFTSPLTQRTDIRIGYFGNLGSNVGLDLGAEYLWLQSRKIREVKRGRKEVRRQLLLTGNFGYTTNVATATQNGVFAQAGLIARRINAKRWMFSILLHPLGAYRSMLPTTYEVVGEEVTEVAWPGRSYYAPSIAIGLGRSRKEAKRAGWYLNLQYTKLANYNADVLPLLSLHFGCQFNFSK